MIGLFHGCLTLGWVPRYGLEFKVTLRDPLQLSLGEGENLAELEVEKSALTLSSFNVKKLPIKIDLL